jgi:hypothetical protein
MEITKHVGGDVIDECSGKWSNHLVGMEDGRPPNVASKYQPNGDRERCR